LKKKNVKNKGTFFKSPTIADSWSTQSRWMDCLPSKNGTGAVMGAGSLKPFFPIRAAPAAQSLFELL
jgi:hypothetical protein